MGATLWLLLTRLAPLVGPGGEGGEIGGTLATGGHLLTRPIPCMVALGEEGRDTGATLWPLLTRPGEEGRDMGETPWPLLTRPGEEGRDMGATPWLLLTPHQPHPSPLG